ncbi:amino acid permease [Pseudonocardiaceae bacterium YIM PH 21723]|nr:amino acid permease [Pseudonocardiaceae bacterium YIM PH 21723]
MTTLDNKQTEAGLQRKLGLVGVTSLGIGSIIGTGIFTVLGDAVPLAGPAALVSFVLAAATCAFSALSYAELAAAIPVSGSAYSYAKAALGPLVAFLVGWNLCLEYGLSVGAVASSWSQYFHALLKSWFGVELPAALTATPAQGGWLDLPAALIVLLCTLLLVKGVKETSWFNTAMVILKIGVLVLFIGIAAFAFDPANMTPFAPHGVSGISAAAALLFFCYIGFDTVSTASEEVKDPQRTLPKAILASLVISTVLFCAVALAALGAMPAEQMAGNEALLSRIIDRVTGIGWGYWLLTVGAVIALTSVVLTVLYGQTRILFAMSRDGMLPKAFGTVDERRGTPVVNTLFVGILIALLAAFVPLDVIVELTTIGTLTAFAAVNVAVLVLRRTRPEMERPFRAPGAPVTPVLGLLMCLYLAISLPSVTWIRFVVWGAIGVAVYWFFSRRNATV